MFEDIYPTYIETALCLIALALFLIAGTLWHLLKEVRAFLQVYAVKLTRGDPP